MRDPMDDASPRWFGRSVPAAAFRRRDTIHGLYSEAVFRTACLREPSWRCRRGDASSRASGSQAAAIAYLDLEVWLRGRFPLHDGNPSRRTGARLTKVRGVGRWPLRWFLCVQLVATRRVACPTTRPQGWALIHKLKEPPPPLALEPLCAQFPPVRSVPRVLLEAVDTSTGLDTSEPV